MLYPQHNNVPLQRLRVHNCMRPSPALQRPTARSWCSCSYPVERGVCFSADTRNATMMQHPTTRPLQALQLLPGNSHVPLLCRATAKGFPHHFCRTTTLEQQCPGWTAAPDGATIKQAGNVSKFVGTTKATVDDEQGDDSGSVHREFAQPCLCQLTTHPRRKRQRSIQVCIGWKPV